MMPLEVVCGVCGEPLYFGMELTSPRDVLKMKRGICHKCGSKLTPEFTLEVTRREAHMLPPRPIKALATIDREGL